MKRIKIKIIALLVAVALSVTVATHTDNVGMEHLEDSSTKCVVISKKVKDKKRYHRG